MGTRLCGTLVFILVITKRYPCLKFSSKSKEAGSKEPLEKPRKALLTGVF